MWKGNKNVQKARQQWLDPTRYAITTKKWKNKLNSQTTGREKKNGGRVTNVSGKTDKNTLQINRDILFASQSVKISG